MAAAETDSKYQQVGRQDQAQQQPPAYYMANGQGNVTYAVGPSSNPACYPHPHPDQYRSQVTILSPNQQGPNVVVTQPVVVTSRVDTTCAFVLSVLSTIFCGFCCGAVAMLLSWKAKLLVLDKKYEHARATLRMTWAFVGVGVCFGILIWVYAVWYSSWYFY